ncbi:MAG: glycine cleavage system protein GcvH [Deltaproteobacteria bacterium]|nr:MAG: glycine cleavage system protein GcvH [Deltaproteobacteria bacterium]
MNFPEGLLYSEHDEWVKVDGDVLTLGISDYAQDALGELVHVELPDVGDEIAAGEAVCEVESVKAVAEVYSPVDGEIIAVNEDLDGEEETINTDPYGAGWLVKIRFTDASQLEGMLSVEAYRKKVDEA